MIGANLNVAALYIVAVGAISTLGIIMAGWSSNNKYALIGAFRMVAMVVSYEVPMVLTLLIPVILAHSMGFQDIVNAQSGVWFIVMAPIAAVMFYTTSIAELGRAPFDIVEAESEIVAGFHIEYTGIRFGLFYAGELLHALTISAFVATLFFGGWHGWGVEQVPILGVFYLFFKTFIIYWSITWVKYSLPRLRIDQMMDFCWKFLTPLALCLVIVTALLEKLLSGVVHPVFYALCQLSANIIIAWIVVQVLRSYAGQERQKVGKERQVATAPIVEFTEPVMIEEE
jgi:NADH-quinone oxidoreductase subunit H